MPLGYHTAVVTAQPEQQPAQICKALVGSGILGSRESPRRDRAAGGAFLLTSSAGGALKAPLV
eukprot:scaffold68617_cov14-Tisochrysis_lutea.AAC.1